MPANPSTAYVSKTDGEAPMHDDRAEAAGRAEQRGWL
ncbi:MAG: hypothetical protein QOE01_3225 [Actinomycetota bacterium]|jgi:hypothetical protein|nr:hypothetical protein [Actinomycetota bacterium]